MKKNKYVAPSVEVSKVVLRSELLASSMPNANNNNADNSEVFGKDRASDEDAYSGLW